jgi:hypothetical protein
MAPFVLCSTDLADWLGFRVYMLFSPYLLRRLAVAAGLYPGIAQTCPGKGGSVPRAHQAITDLWIFG